MSISIINVLFRDHLYCNYHYAFFIYNSCGQLSPAAYYFLQRRNECKLTNHVIIGGGHNNINTCKSLQNPNHPYNKYSCEVVFLGTVLKYNTYIYIYSVYAAYLWCSFTWLCYIYFTDHIQPIYMLCTCWVVINVFLSENMKMTLHILLA